MAITVLTPSLVGLLDMQWVLFSPSVLKIMRLNRTHTQQRPVYEDIDLLQKPRGFEGSQSIAALQMS